MRRLSLAVSLCLAGSFLATAAVSLATAESPDAQVREQLRSCIRVDTRTSAECAQLVLDRVLPQLGVERVNIALAEAVGDAGPIGAAACHVLTERLGATWARMRGPAALDSLVYSCLGGTIHGVFYALGEQIPARDMAALSTGVCERFGQGRSWIEGWDCRHGVGHAMGLDESMTPLEALNACRRIYAKESDVGDCASGVIGSVVDRLGKGEEAGDFDARDPLGWCRSHLEGILLQTCAPRAPAILYGVGMPLERVAGYCQPEDRDCVYGVGYVAGMPDTDWSPQRRIDVCRRFPVSTAKACIAGMMRNLMPDYHLADRDPGVCPLAGPLEQTCWSELELMKERELSLDEILGRAPLPPTSDTDPAGWPRDL